MEGSSRHKVFLSHFFGGGTDRSTRSAEKPLARALHPGETTLAFSDAGVKNPAFGRNVDQQGEILRANPLIALEKKMTKDFRR
ncbi:MAG: hypothetical protein AAFX50_22555 [Acidobacteriota bacterium]